jgi:lysozyme
MAIQDHKGKLAATVGAGVAALLTSQVPAFEGMILRGYKDPIGIVTACAGHTKTAVLGRPYTLAKCQELLAQDLQEHADGVLKCVPGLKAPEREYQRAASVSFAFNIGVPKFCGSQMAYKLNHKDYAGACAELNRWTKAGGKVLPGLVKRRKIETAMCLGEIK